MPNAGSKELNQLAKARKLADRCMELQINSGTLRTLTDDQWGMLRIVAGITPSKDSDVQPSAETREMTCQVLEDREDTLMKYKREILQRSCNRYTPIDSYILGLQKRPRRGVSAKASDIV